MGLQPPPETPENSLAQAAVLMAGTRSKIARIAESHFRDGTTADIVFQETWIVVWRKWDTLAGHPDPVGFVVTTAKHICRRIVALEERQRRVERRLAALATAPAGDADLGERDRVERAIAELSPRQREAIVYRYYLDFDIAETADAMGIRPGTAKALLSQAHARLKSLLLDDERRPR